MSLRKESKFDSIDDSLPIRGILFSGDNLTHYAQALAQVHNQSRTLVAKFSVRGWVKKNLKKVFISTQNLKKAEREKYTQNEASAWLLENTHLQRSLANQISNLLTSEFENQLPRIGQGSLEGAPCVLGIVWALVAHSDSLFHSDNTRKFILAYQSVRPLTLKELAFVPLCFHLVHLENLKRLALRLSSSHDSIRDANLFADELLLNGKNGKKLDVFLFQSLAKQRPSKTFMAQLFRRLRFHEDNVGMIHKKLEIYLEFDTLKREEMIHFELAEQARLGASMRNLIQSIRVLQTHNWTGYLESVSEVHATLSGSNTYAEMDENTRGLYRNQLEKLAKYCSKSEQEMATIIVQLGKTQSSEMKRDVGYYLLREGKRELKKLVSYKETPIHRLKKGVKWLTRRHFHLLYLLGAAGITCLFMFLFENGDHFSPTGPIKGLLFSFLIWLVTLEIFYQILSRLIVCYVNPERLPRVEFKSGVPDSCRTMLVVPCILYNIESIDEQLLQLEIHHLSQPEDNLFFALITDLEDSSQEQTPDDIQFVKTLFSKLDKLNLTYKKSGSGEPRFYVFHRNRAFNAQEGCWMGWERKRGKLEELNRLLLGLGNTSFALRNDEPISVPKNIKYVLTVDADTKLPRDSAKKLIETMAHPLNAPKWNEMRTEIISGYTILQPRMTPTLPNHSENTWFRYLSASKVGLDPYSGLVSDVYQDLFHESRFMGKGIYELKTFSEVMNHKINENEVLSHDLLEGIFVRCGFVSDVTFFESIPVHSGVADVRNHRWIRGDWQLLPWILGFRGKVSCVGRAHMINNLRRSLLDPVVITLFYFSSVVFGVAALPVFLLLLFYLFLPSFLFLAVSLLSLKKRHFNLFYFHKTSKIFLVEFLHNVVRLGLLPHTALVALDAIGKAVFRMIGSKKLRLQWSTSIRVEMSSSFKLQNFARHMKVSLSLTLLGWLVMYLGNPPVAKLLFPLFLLWMGSPLTAFWVSRRPIIKEKVKLTDREIAYLQESARRSWQYFSEFVTSEESDLPPDNYQSDPEPRLAHRTSPTNIGLYLVGVCCAREMGWIGIQEMSNRLHRTLSSLKQLEKFNGHFLNWYDTQTKKALLPKYVSTADSGNLVASLMTVANACREFLSGIEENRGCLETKKLGDLEESWTITLESIVQICEEFINDSHFGFLLNREQRLLSLGKNGVDDSLDLGCYDLLASEARLTSFVAIAKGDVDSSHWFQLGRSLVSTEKDKALVSWSGSLFEYLMPSLFMRSPENSILEDSCLQAILEHIQFGKQHQIPWGMSESTYFKRDTNMEYQYSGFGVPRLGLNPKLEGNRVVAPYATLLALPILTKSALANLKVLQDLGALGPYGFYDALDFTPHRCPPKTKFVVIKTHMAHHQGMGLLSIFNTLKDGCIQRWFHADPRVRSAELLLQEATPLDLGASPVLSECIFEGKVNQLVEDVDRVYHSLNRRIPITQVLSNRSLSTLVTSSGSGYTKVGDTFLTQWVEDVTQDMGGTYFFIRNLSTQKLWSAGFQPTQVKSEDYEVTFSEDNVKFHRSDEDIVTEMEIFVSPLDNSEIRQLSFQNRGSGVASLEVTSYLEVALSTCSAFEAHPVFSKLFLETEYLSASNALVAKRRPRGKNDPTSWMFHMILGVDLHLNQVSFETNRAHFLGRDGSLSKPKYFTLGNRPMGTTGGVMDPILSLSARFQIGPNDLLTISFVTGFSYSKSELLLQIENFKSSANLNSLSRLSWLQCRAHLNFLGVELGEAHVFQRLLSRLIFNDSTLRLSSNNLLNNCLDLGSLWGLEISGDHPLIFVTIDHREQKSLIQQLMRAKLYFWHHGMNCELVILIDCPHSYHQELQRDLEKLVERSQLGSANSKRRGRVVFLNRNQLSLDQILLLMSEARVILNASLGNLWDQARFEIREPKWDSPPKAKFSAEPFDDAVLLPKPDLELWNGYGGFSKQGKEYSILLESGVVTPAPWTNVIANPHFGCVVSETGAGFTWAKNSREFQITPWLNDPILNPTGEAIYIQDARSGQTWCPTAGPIRVNEASYHCHHGLGYSRYETLIQGIYSHLVVFVDSTESVRTNWVELENRTSAVKRIKLTCYVEWTLGFSRSKMAPTTLTSFDKLNEVVFAWNPRHPVFGKQVAFHGVGWSSFPDFLSVNYTCDRKEFMGRNSNLAKPKSLVNQIPLSGTSGGGYDPCSALEVTLDLLPGEKKSLVFLLGQADSESMAKSLFIKQKGINPADSLNQVKQMWQGFASPIQVDTPDCKWSHLLNHWLIYQVISCRLWSRCSFYQLGGAFGFRDQLQDVLALLHVKPSLARSQILLCASRQFLEGDVQHWWHPPEGTGIRTGISDDFLWLPFVVAAYVEVTKDFEILDEMVGFLESEVLTPPWKDQYQLPRQSNLKATLREHCYRAIDHGLTQGRHGLPLMGAGDWNDSMNQIGEKGQGESVWLGWFTMAVLRRFIPIAQKAQDLARAAKWEHWFQHYHNAIETHAWDGNWYLRAFTDEGDKVGSHSNEECKMDSLAQSWAVLSGVGPTARSRKAMEAVLAQLVDAKHKMVLLFYPPFNKSNQYPGYIKGYLPGVRENGGQYTHAACWVTWAASQLGFSDEANQIFDFINPLTHTSNALDCQRYLLEPYVMPADVYFSKGHEGRGGWSWYTGAAGWYYQTGLEGLLGFLIRGDEVTIKPQVPKSWQCYRINIKFKSSTYQFNIEKSEDLKLKSAHFVLLDDGLMHHLNVTLHW